VVGAGPTGLACAIEAKRAGLRPVVVDKGCLANSIFHYPTYMVFFTTPELMEIGDMPMTTAGEKATRLEALKYYRKVAEHYALEMRLYERVERIGGQDGKFEIATRAEQGIEKRYESRKLVIATGYYDLPNLLNVPGEEASKVSHYYREAHPFYNREVAVIGGGNSAAEAALDLFRGGARVTLIHRGQQLGESIKYWIRPDLENRIKEGEIRALLGTRVARIEPDCLVCSDGAGELRLQNDFVFALTGYHPDFDFLCRHGIELDPVSLRPKCDPETLESNVPGIHLAGVIIAGMNTGEIFIENGRLHGRQIARALTGQF
jgi:thioredoxin reductase (NADPH)